MSRSLIRTFPNDTPQPDFFRHPPQYMIHASVEEFWGDDTFLTHQSFNWEVVRDVAITRHNTLCNRIQAGYQVDELWGYSAKGPNSPEYSWVHRVDCLVEIHIGCQHPSAEVTQTVSEDTECQDAIYGRLLWCETTLLMALVS